MINNKLTYISLFSSAGVGCYGFKLEDYKCIATNELIEKRLHIQKINKKCDYESGYINGDITLDITKNLIYEEIKMWNKLGNDNVDAIIATPPCQGMSVANHKKNDNDKNRNSLVVESIEIIKNIQPNFFIFENVPAFMKTYCINKKSKFITIKDEIEETLGLDYNIKYKVLNFKDYGSNSSRKRTLVIGVNKKYNNSICIESLFPSLQKEKPLREIIGDLPILDWGEFDNNDFWHQFRTYSVHMRDWIKDIKEGESAFDNLEDEKKPHKIVNDKIVINAQKNGDKYKRNYWNKVSPCIHTRNDILSSQNTIHPEQDRVFSIRELMLLMTIPKEFKWIDFTLKELNELPLEEKYKILKKCESNVRKSIGEAVPTIIFSQIAQNIKVNIV